MRWFWLLIAIAAVGFTASHAAEIWVYLHWATNRGTVVLGLMSAIIGLGLCCLWPTRYFR